MFTEKQARELVYKINSTLELLGLNHVALDKIIFPQSYVTVVRLCCSRKVAKLIEALIPFIDTSGKYFEYNYDYNFAINIFDV